MNGDEGREEYLREIDEEQQHLENVSAEGEALNQIAIEEAKNSVERFFDLLRDSGTFFDGEVDSEGLSVCYNMGVRFTSGVPITEEMWQNMFLTNLGLLKRFFKKWDKPWWKRILHLG